MPDDDRRGEAGRGDLTPDGDGTQAPQTPGQPPQVDATSETPALSAACESAVHAVHDPSQVAPAGPQKTDPALQDVTEPAKGAPASGEAAEPASTATEDITTPAQNGANKAQLTRRLRVWAHVKDGVSSAPAVLRRGITVTFLVLTALALATGAYAVRLRPDTSVPQPFPITFVKLNFTASRPATSPVTLSEVLSDDENGFDAVSLDITASGADLAHGGWSLEVDVPSVVQLNSQINGVRISQSGGAAQVLAVPGPQKDKSFEVDLGWKDRLQGPMQLEGPNLHAIFPLVLVTNEKSRSRRSPPTPRVTAEQSLSFFSDYVPIGGSFPDHIDPTGGGWSWKPETSRVNASNAVGGVDVEAQSPTMNEHAQSDVFLSGVVFGLAGAALIAAVQEFVSAATRKKSRDTETMAA